MSNNEKNDKQNQPDTTSMEQIFGKNIEKSQPTSEKYVNNSTSSTQLSEEKDDLTRFNELMKEESAKQQTAQMENGPSKYEDYQLNNLVRSSKESAAEPNYNSVSLASVGTSEEEIKKLEKIYGSNNETETSSINLEEEIKTQTSNSSNSSTPVPKKKSSSNKKESAEKINKDTQKDEVFNIKDKEKEATIKVIRETKESVSEYEQQQLEAEKKKIEEQTKKAEEKIDSIIEELEAEMKQPDLTEGTELETNENEPDKFKISTFKVDKNNNRIEVLDNSYKEDEKSEEEEIEYLGGNIKKLDELSFESRANEWGTRYVRAKTVPDKIVGKDLLINNERDFENYTKQKPRFTNAFKTKVALPYSGMTLYVTSYTAATMMQLMKSYGKYRAQYEYAVNSEENLNLAKSEAYLKLRRIELESIYNHISGIYLVNKGHIEKPDMETLFKMIKYPDLPALYFAVYHGTNKNKRKKYTITCRNELVDKETGQISICNTDTQHEFYDEELVFSIGNKKLTKEDFYKLIRDGYPKDQILPITEDAKVEIERMTETKTNIVQGVPSIYDYLETLEILYDFMSDDDLSAAFDYDLSIIDYEIPSDEWDSPKYDGVKFLKSFLYTKRVNILWLDNADKKEGSYRTLDSAKGQRRWVFDVLQSLDLEDIYFLTKGPEIKKMMSLKAIDYYIPETVCSNPNCKNVIKPIKFDIRTNFFIHLSVARMGI